jgi:hypothetical protein
MLNATARLSLMTVGQSPVAKFPSGSSVTSSTLMDFDGPQTHNKAAYLQSDGGFMMCPVLQLITLSKGESSRQKNGTVCAHDGTANKSTQRSSRYVPQRLFAPARFVFRPVLRISCLPCNSRWHSQRIKIYQVADS